ncbi:hypothetical protein X915_gp056 [Bacillus phage vB_BanS-Tsamsa]|uniref:DUF7336 domain-containing protein n=1 Tax=Bacillus phage vB_BanS-Tsamsa TaxID=1308863 RepID=U5J9L4_9CAUD|nr:hypothetical protein X915_gp056 [Bacillus phage vB_BanS-Tsamsa]AGI11958.1 hypothetical protein [Bacillus phage vB_BanS-Tsamsa]
MTVFVLYVSYPYEGGYVLGVYSTRKKAEEVMNDEDYVPNKEYAEIKEITLNKFTRIVI